MKMCIHPSRRGLSGHTLLEMLLSLVLLSIVMASVGSAVMFASQAVPDDTRPAGSLIADSHVLSRIAEDLSVAQYVIEQADHAVTIVVSDRTGDDIPDRIRYAWSGVVGEPLFYQLNDENAIALIDSVAVFELTDTLTSAAQTLPAARYLGAETLVASYDKDVSGGDETVEATDWYGQSLSPVLTADAIGFVPTRTELYAGWKNPRDGQVLISIRDFSTPTPGDLTYASAVLDESLMSGATYWRSLDLEGGSAVSDDETISLTATFVSGTDVALCLRRSSSGSGLLSTTDGGGSWQRDDGKGLLYRLYGKEILVNKTTYQVARQHLTRIHVSLQRTGDGRSPVQRNVVLMQAPPVLTGFAQSDLDVDPTTMDLNADIEADWSHGDGRLAKTSLSDGIWTCDGDLSYTHKSLASAEVVRVRARMRSNDVLGPTVYGPYTFNERDELLPLAVQLRSDGNGGQELVVYNDTELKAEAMVLSGLPSGLVDVGLTLVPGEDFVSIEINHQPIASLVLDRVADPGTIESAVRFGSSGGVAEFGSIEIAVGGTYTDATPDASLLEINVGGVGVSVQ